MLLVFPPLLDPPRSHADCQELQTQIALPDFTSRSFELAGAQRSHDLAEAGAFAVHQQVDA